MRRRLGWQVGTLVGAAILIASVALVSLVLAVQALERTTQQARAHERVATRAERVRAMVVDAETAVRGFVITGEERFLAPLEQTQRELSPTTGLIFVDVQTPREQQLADTLASRASAYLVDYALPTVDQARVDRASARATVVNEVGKRRVDEIRGEVDALVDVASLAAREREIAADARARTAYISAVLAGAAIIAVLVILVVGLRRRAIVPVRAAAQAAEHIGKGDLTTRLPAGRVDEVGQLTDAINVMAARLQETADELDAQHTELESQNAELEAQSVELEAQTAELERRERELLESHATLRGRTRELERTSTQLRQTTERVQLYASVAESLAQMPTTVQRAERVLRAIGDAVRAPVGAIYLRASPTAEEIPLVAWRGLAHAPVTVRAAGGMVQRAVVERRSVFAAYPDGALEVHSFGGRASIRHEAHVPLIVRADEEVLLGVMSLGRTQDEPFSTDDVDVMTHLVTSSSLALYNAIVSTQRAEQAAMMRSVLDSVSEGILVTGADRSVVVSNPPMDAFARRILGLQDSEPWTVDALRDAVLAQAPDRAPGDARARELALNPLAVDRAVFELPDLGIWIQTYAGPVHGPGDTLLGRIVVIRDITEERQAERAKDDLMSTVSHELRTPLAAILGFAELLRTREFPEDERQEYLETVHEQSVRLSELLDDFLDLQRIERRGVDRAGPVDLHEILSEEVQLYSAQSDRHTLQFAPRGGELLVDGDRQRLRRAIGNLLSNAIKYSPDGGTVLVEARQSNGTIELGVVDRGIGIPAEMRERVFDRFVRVDSGAAAAIGGTGLGLSLVRDIIVAHGGQIGVDSVEGEGSRFWVTLPAVDASARAS